MAMKEFQPAFSFRHPCTIRVAGPSQCGKTRFVRMLISHPGYFTPPPSRVIWCYGIENEEQNKEIEKDCIYPIYFHQGIPDLQDLRAKKNSLIIFDDLMEESSSSLEVANLFTKGAHHDNISIILIVQNLFHQGSKSRSISLNGNYLVMFKSPQDKGPINTISSRASFPNKAVLKDAYNQATERANSYLVMDFTQQTCDDKRLCSNILPDEIYYYFVPCDKNEGHKRKRAPWVNDETSLLQGTC